MGAAWGFSCREEWIQRKVCKGLIRKKVLPACAMCPELGKVIPWVFPGLFGLVT